MSGKTLVTSTADEAKKAKADTLEPLQLSELEDLSLYSVAEIAAMINEKTEFSSRDDWEQTDLSYILLGLIESKGLPGHRDAPGTVLSENRSPAWFGFRWKRILAEEFTPKYFNKTLAN